MLIDELVLDRPIAENGAEIELNGVSHGFGDLRVLSHIDLRIAPGEFVSIVGKSGCGKSTLLRLIAGLDQPRAGQIRIGGASVESRKEDLRVMFQEPRLLPWASVADNVAVGLRPGENPDEVGRALQAVQLSEKAGEWPARLSGGQKQRAALARALVNGPRLLMLDEPLGALDALTRLAMQGLIRKIHALEGFTAIPVTHDVAEAVALSDRVIVLGQGHILEDFRIVRVAETPRGSPELLRIEQEILARIMG
ncbi:ATP-binding cassette domain-containing protein [Paracoccus sp. DMF-8]|uniref:ABC transporter ATP-binding protein n=1 Tax=Paracoccus sp. DMF-8 TaxID=3019445 RepID=UPI0023E75EDD|nr:ATP-binding cassette domain-containing protein [Paracoccus sp. DMF-8]MDF3605151.1 ATP-binding cassette domain-containing protein [Paracoccus sp. DMF-8]